uniref:Pantothenate synthetase n=1 Tax=uncultured Spirochaetales bacterium HF0500_06B09 TaxID=710994 RepID=E0XY81_9SPIR|nr:panthothenate synthetase [uncultured Spirochaetales bacterium HF0500_06B09]
MTVVERIDQVRAFVQNSGQSTIGMVATLGALHAGHRSLIEFARAAGDTVVATLFLNPMQFNSDNDIDSYPRTRDADLKLLRDAGAALVFAPSVETMYPPHCDTAVVPGHVAKRLEGMKRPGHFQGVCTVVAKLLNIVTPARAYFGQKDAQQIAVIRRMVSDLDMDVTIVICPTVRDSDGIALSSRNILLSPKERSRAVVIPRALEACREHFRAGERDAEALRVILRERLSNTVDLEYASVADPDSMDELDTVTQQGIASVAARIGTVRLIDNVPLTLSD